MKHNAMAIACLVLGLILGPGYYLYSKFHSGHVVAEYPLKPEISGFSPLPIPLPPDSLPKRLILKLELDHGPATANPPRNRYRIHTSHSAGNGSREISLSSSTTESGRQIHLQEIARLSGLHGQTLNVEINAVGEQEMRVLSASLELRSGVIEPAPSVYVAGAVLLSIGLAMLIF